MLKISIGGGLGFELFDDNPPNGMYYYILTLTDFDGKFEYHNTIVTGCDEKSQISIFPNPFNTNLIATIPKEWDLPINIQVVDYLGRNIKSLFIENEIPTLNISLDESIPNGTYFIKVFNEKNQFIQKIIKMK